MKDNASVRQLAVTAFTGLLTPAAAVAGLDWRGALLAVPVVLLAAYCWGRLGSETGGWTAGWKKGRRFLLSALYFLWAVAAAGTVLAAAGARMTAPDGKNAGWVIALVWLPVLLLTRKGTAAYGRAAEIFYFGMLAALVFVLVLGGRQIRPEHLLRETGGLWPAFLSAAGIGCGGAAALLLWNGKGEGDQSRWLAWSGTLAGVICLMRVVTVGVLGPTLARGQERPFFLMTVGVGQTARVEGLVSAIWLLADVTLAGLMLQCGKRMWGTLGLAWEGKAPWVISLAALGVGLWLNGEGAAELWLKEMLPAAGLVLGGVIPALACLTGRWKAVALQRKSGKKPGGSENKKR